MTDNALVTTNGSGPALAHYQGREEVRELGDRLMRMHPAAGEVGPDAMRAAAQLALLLGANPLPGVNEIHIWRDNKGRNCMSLGINFWRRKAEEWGGVLYEVRPRLMRPEEAADYGVPSGTTAAICKGVRANDMIKYRGLGFTANEVWDMCGRTGVGTTTANEYAKMGRPPSWTALKRAETDMLRQLFPAEFGHVDRQMIDSDAPVIVGPDVDVIDGEAEEGEAPHSLYTLADANRDLFGAETAAPTPPPPAPATNGHDSGGPLADDEQVIKETAAEQYLATVAALLDTDADTVKARLKALGYTGISRYVEQRLDTYRLLRDDRPKSLQADLFGDDNAAALATAQDKQS
jgi:hypothetical protein